MSESLQRAHYDRIAADYEAHYDDPTSRRYRERFYLAPLLAGLDLRGKQVLEAMCGAGSTTVPLQRAGARVIGLDLSAEMLRGFVQRSPATPALRGSVLRIPLADASLDAVFVVGGLHHLQPHVARAVDELHRVLRPGGTLGLVEPHSAAWLDRLRRAWYRRDALFEANEEAIDVEALKRENAHRFRFVVEHYGGNVAYYAVLNSLILRIPLAWKRWYAPALLALERLLTPLQTAATASFVVARWEKRR